MTEKPEEVVTYFRKARVSSHWTYGYFILFATPQIPVRDIRNPRYVILSDDKMGCHFRIFLEWFLHKSTIDFNLCQNYTDFWEHFRDSAKVSSHCSVNVLWDPSRREMVEQNWVFNPQTAIRKNGTIKIHCAGDTERNFGRAVCSNVFWSGMRSHMWCENEVVAFLSPR